MSDLYKKKRENLILNIEKRDEMLEINMEFARGMLFIRLTGILSKRTSKELKETLDRMIDEQGIKYFVINLESLDYIDEEGIQLIMNRYFDVTLHEGRLVICGYNHHIQKRVKKDLERAFRNIESSTNELTALHLINI